MTAAAQQPASGLSGLSDELANAVERAGRSIVTVSARPRQSASGILWRTSQGETIVLTADHVIEREDEIGITLPDGREAKAQLIGRDPSTDLAALRLSGIDMGTTALPAELGGTAKVGNLVLAVGRPGPSGPRASMGIVSLVEGPRRSWQGGEIESIIHADLTLYPGFSGGPLVDLAGRVVGMNSSHLMRMASTALPVTTLGRVADSLLTHGRIRRGYLGVGTQPVALPAALAQKAGITQDVALLVASIEQGSPADKGGVLIGDLIVALGGQPVTDATSLRGQLGPDRVGKPLAVKVLRGGEPAEVTVTVGERE
ncbi:MAG TPA: trypsin-like peptidase domain-containing protein [Ktedonobacterales bacterium]